MRLFFLEGECAPASQRGSFFLFLSSILLSLSSCTTIPATLHVSPAVASLARRVATLAAGSGARMGIVALHVESGRRLELNAADAFEAASVVKIALLT